MYSKSNIGKNNDEELLKACSNTIESIHTGSILGERVPNCLKLTLRKSSVRRNYVCQLRNHCEDKSFVVTHTCSSSTPSQVKLSTRNDMGTEDEFSCSISEKRSRNAWGSCVEIFRDFKVMPETEDEIVTISNEDLNTRTGMKRQKPWIEVPNDEVGAIVSLQGILDTTATSIVVIPKLHNRFVLPLFGGDMDCSTDLGYAYRQKRQICINQGCTFTNVQKIKERTCAPPSEEEKALIKIEPIDWRRSKRTSDHVLLKDKERNVPHFAQNAAKGPLLSWSQITPLDGGTTQIRLDGEIVDCVQVGVTNVKFAVTDGRVKEFSCMFSSVAFENYSVTHSLTYS